MNRRRFLALGGGAMLAPIAARSPLARAALATPSATHFRMALPAGALAAGAARNRWRTTAPLRAPGRFDLVGLRWRGDRHARVQLRTRRHRRWSRWVELPLLGHGPDGRRPPPGTEPAWTGGSDSFQLRLDRRLADVEVHFVNSTGTLGASGRLRARLREARAAARRALGGGAMTSAGTPRVIPRAAWGGDQLPPKSAPRYGSVKVAFVHHTVGTNDYGPEDSAAIVLGIAKYHRNANGWDDIGYNFLVDKYGQIFEGRAGGIDRAVVGAQAAGYNSVSTGVSNLGTFSTVSQTDAGVRACAALIAWKLGIHGVPVAGSVAANGKTFQRISGHRDANATACPGDALYGQLPRIRDLAAQGAGPIGEQPSLTLQAQDAALDWGEAALVSGRLTLPGASTIERGATVELQVAGERGYRTAKRVRLDSSGRWSTHLRSSRNTRLRARFRVPGGRRVYSNSVRLLVAATVSASLDQHRIPARSSLVVSGRVRPDKRLVIVVVERRSGSGFRRVANVRVRPRMGRFKRSLRLDRPGLHRITVRVPADRRNASATSRELTVRVGRRARSGGAALG